MTLFKDSILEFDMFYPRIDPWIHIHLPRYIHSILQWLILESIMTLFKDSILEIDMVYSRINPWIHIIYPSIQGCPWNSCLPFMASYYTHILVPYHISVLPIATDQRTLRPLLAAPASVAPVRRRRNFFGTSNSYSAKSLLLNKELVVILFRLIELICHLSLDNKLFWVGGRPSHSGPATGCGRIWFISI